MSTWRAGTWATGVWRAACWRGMSAAAGAVFGRRLERNTQTAQRLTGPATDRPASDPAVRSASIAIAERSAAGGGHRLVAGTTTLRPAGSTGSRTAQRSTACR